MKYVLIALALGASASVQAQPPINPNSFEFECRFESPSLGKEPGVSCEVEGIVCASILGTSEHAKCVEIVSIPGSNSELKVRCTDGFRLFDRHTQIAVEHDDFAILGRDEDNRSFLTIFDLESISPTDHGRHHKFDAELVNVFDEGALKLEGACRVKFVRPGPPPAPPGPPADL